MPNYDLGTAHGKIVIENDNRGSTDAVKSLAALEAASASLSKSFGDTEKSLNNFGNTVGKAKKATEDADAGVRKMSSGLSGLVSSASAATGNLQGLASQLKSVADQTLQTSNRIVQLNKNIQKFTTIGGVFSSLFDGLTNVDKEMARMPSWAQNIVQLNRKFSDLRTAASILTSVGGRAASLVAGTAAFGVVASRATRLAGSFRTLGTYALAFIPGLSRATGAITNMGEKLTGAAKGLGQFGAGVFQATKGFSQILTGSLLIGKAFEGIGVAAKYAVIGMSAIAGGAAIMQVLGTTVLGLWDGAKQLSGAFVLLPGAIIAAGLTAGVAKLAFGGLKDAFKAAGKDGKEYTKALDALSPQMQAVAKAAKQMHDATGLIRDLAQMTAIGDFATYVQQLGSAYLPVMAIGASAVGTGLNRVASGIKDFLLQGRTITDVNKSFDLTHQILDNLSRAVAPLLSAFLDMGVVGLQVLTQISNGAGQAAVRFANFINTARNDGELKQFMLDGVKGFKDLYTIIEQTGKIFESIFNAFGANGHDALDRVTKDMTRLATAMQNSARGGGLDQVVTSLKSLTSNSVKEVSTAFTQLVGILKSLAPFAKEMQQAFGTGLVTVFTAVGSAANFMAKVLSSIPGLGGIIGTILSLGAAIKAFGFLFIPVTRAIQLFVGTLTLIRGGVNAVAGLSAALTSAGEGAGVFALALGKVRTGLTILAAGATFAAAAIASLLVGFIAVQSASSGMAAANKENAEYTKALKQQTDDLIASLTESGGALSKNVFKTLTSSLQDMQTHLQNQASEIPSLFQKSGAGLQTIFGAPGATMKAFADSITGNFAAAGRALQGTAVAGSIGLDRMGTSAKRAQEELQQTGFSTQELAQLAVGGNADILKLQEALAKTANGGRDASAFLADFRNRSLGIIQSMGELGPDAINLSEAFKTLGDAGASASDKMDALRKALQALGILESSAQEAAFDTAKSVKAIVDATSGFKAAGEDTAPILNAMGQLNGASANAVILRDKLKELGDELIQTASSGGDVEAQYAGMGAAFNALAQQTGMPIEKIKELGQQFGLVPKTLEVLVSVAGQSQAIQEITELQVQLQRLGEGQHTITMVMKDQDAIAALQSIGVQVQKINDQTGEVKITADASQINNLEVLLQSLRNKAQVPIPAPKVEPPQVPPPKPPPAGAVAPVPAPPVEAPQVPPPKPPLPAPPLPAPPIAAPQVPAPIPPPPGPLIPAPAVEVPHVPPLPPIPQPPPVVLSIQGVDAVIGGINSVGGAIDSSISKWNGYGPAIGAAMSAAVGAVNNAAATISASLQGVANSASASGASVGAAFAAGINSQIGAVSAAAMALAKAAAAPLPHSPAEIGPFSGQGWAFYRGKKLSNDFGQGILQGTAAAKSSALQFAESLSSVIDVFSVLTGQVPTSFSANRAPGASGSTFYRDPEISNAKLAEERQKRQEQKAEEARKAALQQEQQAQETEANKNETYRTGESKKTEKRGRERTKQETLQFDKLSSEQQATLNQIVKEGKAAGLDSKELSAAVAAGLAQSNLTKPLPADFYQKLSEGAATTPLDQRAAAAGGGSSAAILKEMKNARTLAQQSVIKQESQGVVLGKQLSAEEKLLEQYRQQNHGLDEAIKIAQSPTSTDAQVIRALQDIDDAATVVKNQDIKDGLDSIEKAVEEDRGIKKYDPTKGASTDPVGDTIKIAQGFLGIYDSIDSGLGKADEVGALLVRGLSSTADVGKLIDGVQGVTQTIGSVISSVSQIISTVASLAALAGAAIPGVGAIAAGAAAVTGGISQANSVVDIIKQITQIGGGIIGSLISTLVGGPQGALTGDVHMLLDTNDNTLKSWSTNNPVDKRSMPIGPNGGVSTVNQNAPQQLNVYAGPGVDPYEMMNQAMFAVRSSSSGVYG